MDRPLGQALFEVLSYMLVSSGIDYRPGVGMSLRPLTDDAFEVLVGDVVIGTLSGTALLELADVIRKERT